MFRYSIEHGWNYILRNERNGIIGNFVTLGVLPFGHTGHKFVEVAGETMLEAMVEITSIARVCETS